MTKVDKNLKSAKVVHEFSDVVTYHLGKRVNLPEGWTMFIGYFSLPYSNKLHEAVYEIKFDFKENDFTHKYYLN